MSLAWFLPLPGSYAGVDVVGVYNFACSLREVLAKHPFLPHGCGLFSGSYFPSFSEGLSLRVRTCSVRRLSIRFPFLFGGTFIEGSASAVSTTSPPNFPSFSEGLSLRDRLPLHLAHRPPFPFLFGGTFIEGNMRGFRRCRAYPFPFLFGGTFIEGCAHFSPREENPSISLPFRRDFH